MALSIENKVCLVTGANRGIGKAITETLLEKGASKIYVAVRDLGSVTDLVSAHPEQLVPVELDLNQPETIQAAAQAAGDVEIVISNAGVLKTATALADNAVDALLAEIEVNVFGLLRMAQAFAPILKANGGGAFVQLNSVASLKCFPDFATYSASKGAAYLITQGLKEQFAQQGTQVVSVHPGPISTDMADAAGIGEMAEPASLVADAIVDALENDKFHAWPDSMAKQFGEAYESFAQQIVLPSMSEG